MALGSPAILTPRILELRGVQNAIGNIRERIEALEKVSGGGFDAQGAVNVTNTQLGVLRIQLDALTARVSALESGSSISGSSDILTLTAIGDIPSDVAVAMVGDANCSTADANDAGHMFAVVGVTTAAAVDGGPARVRRFGAMPINGAAFVKGRAVYVGDGGLTQTPNYESVAIPVGVAVSTTDMWVSPAWPALYAPTFSSADGSQYEQYLPVTYAMVQQVLELVNSLFSQPNGIIVLDSGSLITRTLRTEGNADFEIVNPNGTTGDPIFAFPYSFTPTPGGIVLAGTAPIVLVGLNAQPGAAGLVLTGYTPGVLLQLTVSPGAGLLTLTGNAPSLALSTVPGAGSLQVIGQAPAIVAADGTFVLDTFTGSGDLSTHIGETGATWTVDSGADVSSSDFALDGSGSVYMNTTSAGGQTYEAVNASGSAATGSSNFYIEFDVSIATNSAPSQVLQAFFAAYDNDTNFFGTVIGLFQDTGTGNLVAEASVTTATESPSFATATATHDTVHTIRMEVTNTRKTFTYFLDGVQIDTQTLTTAIPYTPLTQLEIDRQDSTLDSTNVSWVKVSRVKGGSL